MSEITPRAVSEEKQIAHLERTTTERLQEITELQQILEDEQEKTVRFSQQIDEMTDFLADYGLHWVGGDAPTPKSLFPRGPTDMRLFNQRISELNGMVEAGLSFRKETGVTKVYEQSVKIRLKEEGFNLDDGELRLYAQPLNSDFFQDIMDGFFPLEFKDKFPEGVKIIVEDLRTNDLFKGQARKLVESAKRERREMNVIDYSKEIGEGSGKVKVKFSQDKSAMIRVEKETKALALRQMIVDAFGIDEFKLITPSSSEPIDETKTIGELGLFPRGMILVIT